MEQNKICRTALTILEKVEILQAVEKGHQKKSAIASQYGIPSSTLSTLLRNKDRIMKASTTLIDPDRKRTRPPAYPQLEERLASWIKTKRANNEPFDRNGLRAQVREYAPGLGIVNFSISDGWLERFQKRHGLSFRPKRSQKGAYENEVPVKVLKPFVPPVVHDSDGAGSERSSDSDTPVFPIQLIQSERQKRQKRSLCESRPDFLFYGEGALEKNSVQIVVPHALEHHDVKFPNVNGMDDSFEDMTCSQEPETLIKVEEPESESSDDSYTEAMTFETEEPSSTAMVSATEPTSSDSLAFFNNIDAVINAASSTSENAASALQIVTQENASRSEPTDKSTQVYCSMSPIPPEVTTAAAQANGSDIIRLAEAMERQARAQEDLLAYKKGKMAVSEKQHSLEMELLKERLELEQKKVAALEKLLSACMEMIKGGCSRSQDLVKDLVGLT